jgi:hypothetical protein
MFEDIRLKAKDVPAIIRSAFPNYHGRTYHARVTTQVVMDDAYWSGGTRSQYMGVNLRTGRVAPPSRGAFGTWLDQREPTVQLEPGLAIVEHARFCGKDLGLIIHVHPDDVAGMKMLEPRAGGKKRHGASSYCLQPGYAYHLESGDNWQFAPAGYWNTVMASNAIADVARFVGLRWIDSDQMAVFKTLEGYFAQTAVFAKCKRGVGGKKRHGAGIGKLLGEVRKAMGR